jgi:hypothetical protein
VRDINTAVVDSLKVLDLKRPIREVDKVCLLPNTKNSVLWRRRHKHSYEVAPKLSA